MRRDRREGWGARDRVIYCDVVLVSRSLRSLQGRCFVVFLERTVSVYLLEHAIRAKLMIY
jgi:hypothetical protein